MKIKNLDALYMVKVLHQQIFVVLKTGQKKTKPHRIYPHKKINNFTTVMKIIFHYLLLITAIFQTCRLTKPITVIV